MRLKAIWSGPPTAVVPTGIGMTNGKENYQFFKLYVDAMIWKKMGIDPLKF